MRVKDAALQDPDTAQWLLRRITTTQTTFEIVGVEPQEVEGIIKGVQNTAISYKLSDPNSNETTPGAGILSFVQLHTYFYVNTDFASKAHEFTGLKALEKKSIFGVNWSHFLIKDELAGEVLYDRIEEDFVGDLNIHVMTNTAFQKGGSYMPKGGFKNRGNFTTLPSYYEQNKIPYSVGGRVPYFGSFLGFDYDAGLFGEGVRFA